MENAHDAVVRAVSDARLWHVWSRAGCLGICRADTGFGHAWPSTRCPFAERHGSDCGRAALGL